MNASHNNGGTQMRSRRLHGTRISAGFCCALSAVACAGNGARSEEEVRTNGQELVASFNARPDHRHESDVHPPRNVQVGPRPYFLVDSMTESPLKHELEQCSEGPFEPSRFSIGHRGAALQFPEHTRQSYQAAARMGAGIIECDVTFTKDRELVCRHSQCDLHTTTNILAIPELAAKCTQPFTPADPLTGTPASAMCCTSDLSVAEFKSLCGKMDGFNPAATTAADYMRGTPSFRTDTYATCGTLLTHKEYISLVSKLGADFTPELKAASVPMPYQGDYTQEKYAQQMIDEYIAARISPRKVFAQSFNLNDILYWLQNDPAFGKQAVYLDDTVDIPGGYDAAVARVPTLAAQGVRIVAPAMWALVTLDASNHIVPSAYALAAKSAGLDLITWTLERSGPLATTGRTDYYYQSVTNAIHNDGDTYVMLDVLAQQVGIRGIFSDWPATVTYYANCKGL
jgi:glycerophosphoryl diester phosphodiesterase